MKKVVLVCDRCGKENVAGSQSILLHCGRRMDPAGSMEDVTEGVDLCPVCMGEAIRCLSRDHGNEVYHWVTKRK